MDDGGMRMSKMGCMVWVVVCFLHVVNGLGSPQVAMFFNTIMLDGSFNEFCFNGANDATNAYNGNLSYVQNVPTANFAPLMQNSITNGAGFILGISSSSATGIQTVATQYPSYQFGIIDTSLTLPNVASVIFAEDHGGFLAGVISATLSKSQIVGFIGGPDSVASIRRYRNGFANGVYSICPNCKAITTYLNSFTDTTAGANSAFSYISMGVDIIFAAGGATGSAAIRAAAANGTLVIGVGDEYLTTFGNGTVAGVDRLLTCIQKGTYAAAKSLVTSYFANTFSPGTKILDLTNGGIQLTPCRGAACNSYTQQLNVNINATYKGISDGTLKTGVDPITNGQLISISDNQWQNVHPLWSPASRNKHTCVYLSTSGNMLLFGGNTDQGTSGELWAFKLLDLAWNQIPPLPNAVLPSARSGHVAVSFGLGTGMWLFGGRNGINRLNDAWLYNFTTNAWTQVNQTGTWPLGRDLACATRLDATTIILFGGFMSNQEYSNQVWKFSLTTLTWTLFTPTGTIPIPTASASCVNIRGNLMMFGGNDANQVKLDDLYNFNATTAIWTKMNPTTSPKGRSDHVSVMTGDIMWVVGGDTTDATVSEVWAYNTNDNTWTQFSSNSSVSVSSAAAVVTTVGNTARLWLFGGNFASSKLSTTYLYQFPPCFFGSYNNSCTFTSHCTDGSIIDLRTGDCVPCAKGSQFTSITTCTKCAYGYYQPNAGQTICLPCPPGTFGNDTGLVQCHPCTPGTANGFYASQNCSVCDPGTYTSVDYSTSCKACEVNQWSSWSGAAQCLPCPANSQTFVTGVTEITTCYCKAGYYRLNNFTCGECLSGASCEGGTKPPIAATGFWYANESNLLFLACTPPDACPGGLAQTCNLGYSGYRCGSCGNDFYRNGDLCRHCVRPSVQLLFVTFILLMAGALIILIVFIATTTDGVSAAPITINFVQVIGILSSFRLNWSTMILNLSNVFSSANFNMDVFSIECTTVPVNYFMKWIFFILLPLIFVGLLLFFYAIRVFYIRCTRGRVNTEQIRKESLRFEGAFWSVMYVMYLMLVTKTFELFRCTTLPDGHSYMDVAPSEKCYEGTWLSYMPVAVLAIIVYAVGLPGTYFYYIHKNRKTLDDSTLRLRFGFIYTRYRGRYYWWFLLEMARKFGIVMALVFFTKDPTYQAVFFFIVSLSYMAAQAFFLPCRLNTSNILELLLNYIIISMMFFGVIFYTEKLPGDFELSVVAIFWVVFGLFIAGIVIVIEFCRWITTSNLVNRFIKVEEMSSSKSGDVIRQSSSEVILRRMSMVGKIASLGYRT